jgi:flagellar hook-basal body complex protein FliE
MEIKDVTQFPGLVPGIGTLEGGSKPAAAPEDGKPGSFADALQNSIAEVNAMQQKADAAITALATGDKVSLHETMIAMEQADVSFRLMMQVRNKIVEAYQEILRMQV